MALAGPQPSFMFAARSHPAGGALTGALYWDAGPVEVGPYLGAYYYWYETAVAARGRVVGGFLVGSAWAGSELGWFIADDDRDGPRRWGPRPLGRARVEMNLRNDLAWLYTRSTGVVRNHAFREYDPYRDLVLDGIELHGEQSVAAMLSPWHQADRRLWVYVEGTFEGVAGIGSTETMARGGLLGEQILPGVAFDLDFYWSFRDSPVVAGPGVLGVIWWEPPAKKAPR